MPRYKMIIITNPQLAVGFRLAGIELQEARNGEEAGVIISRILKLGREFGIIGIDENLVAEVPSKILAEVEETGIPLIIPFPTTGIYGMDKMRQEKDYTANLIRSAIGYHIKLKRD